VEEEKITQTAVMTHQIQWTTKHKHALHVTLHGDMDWPDLYDMRREVMEHTDSVPGNIDLVFEVPKSVLFPIRFVANRSHVTSSPIFGPNIRQIFIIDASQYIHVMYSIFAAVYPDDMVKRVVFVDTLEDAIKAVEDNPPR
jgi:hypothetical protein